MPIPQWVARSNRRFVNPLMLRLAPHVAPLAVVHHVGRRSGRSFTTPVFAFPIARRDRAAPSPGVVIALTYGADVDWLRNVEAAGRFSLERRARTYGVDRLERRTGAAGAALVPGWTRVALRLLGVDEYLVGRVRAPGPESATESGPPRHRP